MMLLTLLLAQAIAPTPAPLDIYRQAIKTMRSISAPAYLKYTVSIQTIHKGREAVQHFDEFTNVEKTLDRTGKLYVSGDPKTFPSFVRIDPDLFLGHSSGTLDSHALTVQTGAEVDENLKTIATVSVQSHVYDVTKVGTENLPACISAIHLTLRPLIEPMRYNLRDVWINPTTSRICRAVAIWRDPVEFAVPIPTVFTVMLDVDPNGFVDRWTTKGIARFAGLPYAMTQNWTYSNITAATEAALQALGSKSQ